MSAFRPWGKKGGGNGMQGKEFYVLPSTECSWTISMMPTMPGILQLE